MHYYKQDRIVTYHALVGKQCLLADERDKWRLLQSIASCSRAKSWFVYAFCLTDEGIYVLTESDSHTQVQADLRRAVEELPRAEIQSGGEEELDSLQEIAECCRRIHRIPLERGYVRHIGDYWWSSYVTYIGSYEWQMVDCRALSLYFLVNLKDSRCHLQWIPDKSEQEEIE